MAYQTCPDCGERVYNLGCTWCNEDAYIEEQEMFTALEMSERPPAPAAVARCPTSQGEPSTRVGESSSSDLLRITEDGRQEG